MNILHPTSNYDVKLTNFDRESLVKFWLKKWYLRLIHYSSLQFPQSTKFFLSESVCSADLVRSSNIPITAREKLYLKGNRVWESVPLPHFTEKANLQRKVWERKHTAALWLFCIYIRRSAPPQTGWMFVPLLRFYALMAYLEWNFFLRKKSALDRLNY